MTVTAVAGSGFQFSNWSGDLSGNINPTTITMDSDKNITANFGAVFYNPVYIGDQYHWHR